MIKRPFEQWLFEDVEFDGLLQKVKKYIHQELGLGFEEM